MKYNISTNKPFGIYIEPTQFQQKITTIDLHLLRDYLKCEHLVVLRGFRSFTDTKSFTQWCEQWGEVSIWPFGKVLELIEHDQPTDHIFDHSYIPLHWDGMYRPQIPELQIFNCVQAPLPQQGGRTTFSNTILALQNTASQIILLWEKVVGHYERKMEFYWSKTVSPIITKHPYQNFSVIRYNEPHEMRRGNFINPPKINFTGINSEQLNKFHQSLKKMLYAAEHFYAHEWQNGDIVIADNFSLLHGREAFTAKSPRHIQRVHVLSNPPLNNLNLQSYHE